MAINAEPEHVPLIEYVKSRLDNQDTKLDAIVRELRGIHKQTKETNGKVIAQSERIAVIEAVSGEREKERSKWTEWKWVTMPVIVLGVVGLVVNAALIFLESGIVK